MPVIRLIGDEWKFSEKIAVSVPPSKSFLMCTTQLKDKLQIPSWNGCALYWTEGKPPNYVRATIPVSMNSTPGREGMKDGTLLYVKTKVTQGHQNLDREFHEALVEWRKQNHIDGICSDGSDVFEFMDEYASKLNPSSARDVTEHEAETREVILGEEHRAFFVVTFEYREVQQLKDKEQERRAAVVDEYDRDLQSAYRQLVWLPLCAERRSRLLQRDEPSQREQVVQEEGRLRTESLMAEHKRLVNQHADECRRREKDELDRSAPVVRSNPYSVAGSGTMAIPGDFNDRISLLELSLKKETSEIRSLMSSLLVSHTEANRELANSYARVSTTLEKQYLGNLESSMKATLALSEKEFRAPMERDEEFALERKIRALKGLIEEETRGIEDQKIAVAQAECEATRQIASAVLEEQEGLRQRISLKMKELQETRDALHTAERENMELGRLLKMHHVLLEQQDVDLAEAHAALHKYRERVRQGERMIASFAINEVRWKDLSMMEYKSTSGLHPEVYCTCLQAVQRREPIPAYLYEDVLGYPLGYPARNPDHMSAEERLVHDDAVVRGAAVTLAYFKHIVDETALVAQGSPYQVGDELCFRYGIRLHPLRGRFSTLVDDNHPHLAGILDVLLDVFTGREAELMLCLSNVMWHPNEFLSCWDAVAQREYYYHPQSALVTQWVAPTTSS